MSINESRMERAAGVALAAFSAVLFFVVIPAQIKYIPNVYPTPRTFPQIITGILFALSVLLFISGWRKRGNEEQKEFSLSREQAILVGITLIGMAAYIILLPIISYIPSTILLLAGLIYVYGQRNWIKLGAVAVALPIAIYFSFTLLMRLRLP